MKSIIEKRFQGIFNFKSLRCSLNFHKNDRFTQYLRTCAERNVEAEIFDPLTRAVIHRDDNVKSLTRRIQLEEYRILPMTISQLTSL